MGAAVHSAGILVFRRSPSGLEVLIVHPGGPFWARRDEGIWSVPKGLFDPAIERPLDAANREFTEETGFTVRDPFLDLGTLRQRSGKVIHAFAAKGDFDASTSVSNTFQMEWPKGSGRMREFLEVDRAEWFAIPEARAKLLPGQAGFLDRLVEAVGSDGG